MDTRLDRAALLMERYIQDRGQKGYASGTLRLYRQYNNEFLKYLQEDEKLDDLKQVDRQVISRFQSYLYTEERGLGLRSQSLRLVALRNLFRWFEREGILFYDPTTKIELPRKPDQLPHDIFNVEEISRILNAVDIDTKLGLRDKAILELLYTTAIRSGELCNLTLYDVQKEYGTISVKAGKGNKDRVVPVGEVAMGYVEEFLEHGRKNFPNADTLPWLFVTYRGTQMENRNIAPIVQKYTERAGLKRYATAHMIRHTTATHMLRNGAPIRVIQEMLGHRKLETTQIYTQVEISDLKKVHQRTHPREKGLAAS
ncbi:MAG TPA: tyrosine-type recombinase/integrase [Candidatus Omnitrophota bacterium]|nr:tyrosine-type recombinase/integrase [Candidatus Omnitrophota bacterium]